MPEPEAPKELRRRLRCAGRDLRWAHGALPQLYPWDDCVEDEQARLVLAVDWIDKLLERLR